MAKTIHPGTASERSIYNHVLHHNENSLIYI